MNSILIKEINREDNFLHRIFLPVKISLLLLIFGVVQAFGATTYSQSATISLKLKGVAVEDVLNQIEEQTEFHFLYNKKMVDVGRKVDITSDRQKITEVLDRLFQNENVTYVISDRQVVLSSKNEKSETQQGGKKITGVVKDNTGETLPGVSVSDKKGGTGTMTDAEGKFSLNVSNEQTILTFSYLGFVTQDMSVNNKTTLDITMEENAQLLDEVVVVGFGTQKKVNLTGAVGTVDTKELESRPVQNAVQALQGIVPGLNIYAQGNGGELNASKNINIRGTGTIGDGSTGGPLILIDGMDGDISAINPQDIDNISVLKDAAASSIYGSRAPFGVILVTTKKGKEGKPQVNYNNNFHWTNPVLIPKMQNSYEFVNYFNDAATNGGGGAIFDERNVERVYKYMMGELDPNDVVELGAGGKWNYDFSNGNVDWYKEYYQNWVGSQEHNVSVSGGSPKWNYYLSGNYMDQNGLMRYGQDVFNRYTTTAKISGELSKFVSLDYSIRFIRQDYSRARYMNDGFYDNIARRARPTRPIYDPNGKLFADLNYIDAFENGGRYEEEQDWLYQQARITVTPLKDWNIMGEINYRTYTGYTHEYGFKTNAYYADGIRTYQATPSISNEYVYEYTTKGNFFNPNIYTNYTKSFGLHNFKGMLGFQSELYKDRMMSIGRDGLITHDVPVIDRTTVNPARVQGNFNDWATAGFFGRINYDYDGRYLLEANLRYDGTSRFQADKQWNLFPSFSAGWNIAREHFWEPLEQTVGTLKLRASYGELGNQNTKSLYPTYQLIPTGTADGTWIVNGKRPNTSSAPSLISTLLSWERIRTWNVGLDAGLLNNRLTANLDVFNRYTDDMVGPAPSLPQTLGTEVPKTNNTNLKTYGFELSLGWRDIINDFSYGVKLNIADSQTKILSYPNETHSIDTYMEGYLTGNIWGYQTIGIAKSKEEMDAHLATLPNGGQNALGASWDAGDIMYADLNNDGKISGGARTSEDSGDLQIIGNSNPRFTFGLDIDLAWKNFDFRMFWQGVAKRDYFPMGMVFWGTVSGGQWFSTAFKEHLDYFRADQNHVLGQNLDAYYPRPLFSEKNQKTQTRYMQNGAYARLKNMQIGYTLPKSVMNKVKLQRLRIFVSGENLATITNLSKTLDPESLGIGGIEKMGGSVYPLSKIVSVGISLNF